MSFRSALILLVSFTLFSFQCKKSLNDTISLRKKGSLPQYLQNKTQDKIIHNRQGALENALNLGVKRGLNHQLYLKFKALNLLHLFTPSGLHYYPLYALLKYIFSFRILRIYSILFWILCISLDGFYSLKRIAGIKMLSLYRHKLPFSIDLFSVFLIIFFIDFILGSFSHSMLSWGYSFLFLGLLFSDLKAPMLIKIGLGQLLISFFQGFAFNPIGFLSGFIISIYVSFSFPIIFFNYWNPFGDFFSLNHYLMNLLIFLVESGYKLSTLMPPLNPITFSFLSFIMLKKEKLPLVLLVFLI